MVETVRLTTSGQVSAAEVVDAALARIARLDPGAQRDLAWCSPTGPAPRPTRATRAGRRRAPGPLHGVPVVDQGGDRRSRAASPPSAARPTPRRRPPTPRSSRRLRGAGAVVVGDDDDARVRRLPLHGVRRRAASPATRGTASRTPGGSSGGTAVAVATGMVPVGMGGDGGGSIRIPSACCGLFGLKPQRGRVTTAPHPHLWFALGTAGPLTRSVLDSALVYDVIRGNLAGDLYRAGDDRRLRRGGADASPGRLRIGWSTKPVDPRASAPTRSTSARSRTPPGCSPTSATTSARSTRTTPTRPLAFVPQFFAGIRAEADLMEHYDRLERRTRETYRLGAWVTPAGHRVRPAADREGRPRRPTGSSTTSTCCSPRRSRTGRPTVGILDGVGTRPRRCCASMPAIAYAALWNVAGNPAAAVPCGLGRRRPADVGPAGRPHRRRDRRCSASRAQLEAAGPGPGRAC